MQNNNYKSVMFGDTPMYANCPIDSNQASLKDAISGAGLDLNIPVCKKNNTTYEVCEGNKNYNLKCAAPVTASYGAIVICQEKEKLGSTKYKAFYQSDLDCQDGNTFLKL